MQPNVSEQLCIKKGINFTTMVGRGRRKNTHGGVSSPNRVLNAGNRRRFAGENESISEPMLLAANRSSRRRPRDYIPPGMDHSDRSFNIGSWPRIDPYGQTVALSFSGSDTSRSTNSDQLNTFYEALYGAETSSNAATEATDIRVDQFLRHMELLETSQKNGAKTKDDTENTMGVRNKSLRRGSKSPSRQMIGKNSRSPRRHAKRSVDQNDEELDQLILKNSSSSNGASEWFKHLLHEADEVSVKSDSSKKVRWKSKNEERQFNKSLPVDSMTQTENFEQNDPIVGSRTPRSQNANIPAWTDEHRLGPNPKTHAKSHHSSPIPTDDWDFDQKIFPSTIDDNPSSSQRSSSLLKMQKNVTQTFKADKSLVSSGIPRDDMRDDVQRSIIQTTLGSRRISDMSERRDPPLMDSSLLQDRIRNPKFHPSADIAGMESWEKTSSRSSNLDPRPSTAGQKDPDGVHLHQATFFQEDNPNARPENEFEAKTTTVWEKEATNPENQYYYQSRGPFLAEETEEAQEPSPLRGRRASYDSSNDQRGNLSRRSRSSHEMPQLPNQQESEDSSVFENIQQDLGSSSSSGSNTDHRKERGQKSNQKKKMRDRTSSISRASMDSGQESIRELSSDVSLFDSTSGSDSSGEDIFRVHRESADGRGHRSSTKVNDTSKRDSNRSKHRRRSSDGSTPLADNRSRDGQQDDSLDDVFSSNQAQHFENSRQRTFSLDSAERKHRNRKSRKAMPKDHTRKDAESRTFSQGSFNHRPFTSVREASATQHHSVNERGDHHSELQNPQSIHGGGKSDGLHSPFTSVKEAIASTQQQYVDENTASVRNSFSPGAVQATIASKTQLEETPKNSQAANASKSTGHSRDYWKSITALKTLGSFDSLSATPRKPRKSQEYISLEKRNAVQEPLSPMTKQKVDVQAMGNSLTEWSKKKEAKDMAEINIQVETPSQASSMPRPRSDMSQSVSMQSASLLSEAVRAARSGKSEPLTQEGEQSSSKGPNYQSSQMEFSAPKFVEAIGSCEDRSQCKDSITNRTNTSGWSCDDSLLSYPDSAPGSSVNRKKVMSPISETGPESPPTILSQDSNDSSSTQTDRTVVEPNRACCSFTIGDISWGLEWLKGKDF